MSVETTIGLENGALVIRANENGNQRVQTFALKVERYKKTKSVEVLMAELAKLSTADREKLLLAVIADYLARNPDVSGKLSIGVDAEV